MKNRKVVICVATSVLTLSFLLVRVRPRGFQTKSTSVSSDGTVKSKEKTVTQAPDGTVTKKQESTTTSPNN